MVVPTDLPTAEPRWSARRITAAEVLKLWRGEAVPGVSDADPRVQSIRACRLDNHGRLAIAGALRAGYLYVNRTMYHDGVDTRLETRWGWWCAAAGHPEITLSTVRNTDAVALRCDLAPTGKSWDFDAWRTIGRLLHQQQPVGRAGWLFTEQELQLEGLEMEEGIGLARALVLIASGGRFRPQDPSPAPLVHAPVLRHQTRMERSDT
jgi:hypothetical protein